jgi:hypothetical protein
VKEEIDSDVNQASHNPALVVDTKVEGHVPYAELRVVEHAVFKLGYHNYYNSHLRISYSIAS